MQGGFYVQYVLFCCNDYRRTSSVTSMLQELGWEDLQSRRDQNKITMMYTIACNLAAEIPSGQNLTATGAATRGHHQRFLSMHCSINAYKESFFLSTVRLWNGLSTNFISAPTLDALKLLVGASMLRPYCEQRVLSDFKRT